MPSTFAALNLQRAEWALVSNGDQPQFGQVPVVLEGEHLRATSTSNLILRLHGKPTEPLVVSIGGTRERNVYPEGAGEQVRVPASSLLPGPGAFAMPEGLPVELRHGEDNLILAYLPHDLATRGHRLERIERFSFRRIGRVEFVNFPRVAHAAKRGGEIARVVNDPPLRQLFEWVRGQAVEVANDRPLEEGRTEEELRLVLLCLYYMLWDLHLRHGYEFDRSREVKKWVDVAQRYARQIETLQETVKAQYEDLLREGTDDAS